ncbi:aminopeptidase P N-terminal domain-containing protein [Longimicrobium terrae]|uniref:Xaa-Pro aminopeptidase n=1 Tax=Longimicrobium terrae TaxID=1639882 RepID=A0A841GSB7_9BACT|nr:aminopeptidase P N-terminal domain-containing protein [Longimicrobium terrae]MBB4634844.1 Xaa-Pro aminopeptidase [Longimicrobium terrae]MBB6069239.1 Xaa-Pro aminopeptidase [Longimicrobium terrae]NNC31951.1 M24 family metallopeptidase [Longimicrobium terrae]
MTETDLSAADPFRARRERFLDSIGKGVAVIAAAPELVKSRDTDVRYRQNSDFFYLTGFLEPGAVAVLTPFDPEHRFTLFVRPRDRERETWTGVRAGVEGALERFGADKAYPVEELDNHLRDLIEPADALWYALSADGSEMDAKLIRLLTGFRGTRHRTGKGPWDIRDPASVLDRMRVIKEPGELERIREAAALSARGHLAAMRAGRAGVGEWELEALLDGTFRAASADSGTAYPSIVGSGANATVLHYVTNERRIGEGDLVLMDAGADAGFYCGDITRVFPASGRFTAPQRRVYDIVHAALDAGIAAARPGAPITGIHEAARAVLVQGMIDLGLLEGTVDDLIESEAFKRFFMHNTAHYLGLDVHDAGPYRERDGTPVPLQPGMVLTVEPGLYIPADAEDVAEELRGIGIRLEDNVIITGDGCEVITRGVPVAADEVEAVCGGDRE